MLNFHFRKKKQELKYIKYSLWYIRKHPSPLLICRDDFSSFKTFRKSTNVDTIIIVISYNWSKNIAKFLNVFSWNTIQLSRFFSIQLLYISQKYIICSFADFFPRPFIYFSIEIMLEWFLYFLMTADRFPVSKSLFLVETAGLIPNLGTIFNLRSNYFFIFSNIVPCSYFVSEDRFYCSLNLTFRNNHVWSF